MLHLKTGAHAEFLILETELGKKTQIIEGKPETATMRFCPASTIKILIAWMALEESIVTPQTKIVSRDYHVPRTPRLITLHEAMFFSSNDFFIPILKKLGQNRIIQYLSKSGWLSEKPDLSWLKSNLNSLIYGGKLKVSPIEQHNLMLTIATRKLASTPKIHEDLLKILRWPSPDSTIKLYGKTGTYGNAVWFNGFGVKNGSCKIVTVFSTGSISQRDKVISKFYSRVGLKYDKSLVNYLFYKHFDDN